LTGCRRARLAGARGLGLGSIVFLFSARPPVINTVNSRADKQVHGSWLGQLITARTSKNMDDAPLNASPQPTRHIVDLRSLPLLSAHDLNRQSRRSRPRCCSCLCYTLVAVLSALIGSGSTAAVLILADLNGDNCSVPQLPPECPGVCVGRALDGVFEANVSTSKRVVGVTVVVSFSIRHAFFSHNGSATLSVVPHRFEPHWLPNVLHPIDCSPSFTLSDNCTVTLNPDDACLRAAFKADDIVHLMHRWDPSQSTLAVVEQINTGFFTETFEWTERRQRA
jgi:hypothetical protein